MNIRIGQGSDLHRLADGLPLVIGNCSIPHTKGCIAHSDGDVLIHALIDALLGAFALGDIGSHFPDSNSQYKNISSTELLKEVLSLPEFKTSSIINIDSTIHLEQPKLRPFIDQIRSNLAELMNCQINQISVKAKTSEGVGAVGKGEAIACDCIVLLQK